MVTIAEVQQAAGVSESIAREALELGQRKLSGQRIPFRDDPNLSRAKAFVFNRPDFLQSLGRVSQAKTQAERLGFSSIQEAGAAQRQFSTPITPIESSQQFVAGRQVQTLIPTSQTQTLIPTSVPQQTLARPQDILQSIPRQQQFSIAPTIRQERISQQDFGDVSLQTREPTQERLGIREVFFGEAGKALVGFDIRPSVGVGFLPRERDVSFQDIQTFLRSTPTDISLPRIPSTRGVTDFLPRPSEFSGFGVRIGAELIPTTPGEIALTGGLIGASILAPPIVGTGISFGVGALGGRSLIDPSLTIEQRSAAGLVGVLGFAGAAAGVTPFIRGFGARGTRVAPEGFEVLSGFKGVGEIALIEPGSGARVPIDLPPTSPLVRGGFGVRPSEKAQFLARDQFLTTSQRGLFETGRDIPIEREFFVTPQEPTLGIAETRVSRLGLQDPFKFPESVEIGFGLPQRAQIGITRGEVARTETAGAFAIGRGTELEAIRTTGIITDVAQIGRARIRGQGVDIFEFQVGRAPRGAARPRRTREDFFSTEGTSRISGETLLGTLGTIPTRGVSIPTSALVSPLITASISPSITGLFSPPISPPISPGISPPTLPIISPPLVPSISPPTVPIISPPIFPPFDPPTRPPRGRRGKKKEKKVKKGKRITTPIRPSFTAIVLEIETGIPETTVIGGIDLGILPGQIRGTPKRKRKKVSKKKKK